MEAATLFKKRPVHHSLFWVVAIAYSVFEDYNYYPHWGRNIQNNIINVLCFIPFIYLNLYFIIPKLLFAKRYFLYVLMAIVVMVSGGFLVSRINSFVLSNDFYISQYGFIILLRDFLQLFLLTTAIKFIKHWYDNDRQIKDLKNHNLQSELMLIKSQVNPHFLFNTLNSIYYLIGRKPEKGQEAVLKLSGLLSHQLYDNKKDRIELQREVENLKNYIALQEIRYTDTIDIKTYYSSAINGELIAPMLLLPLVENAFKHGNTSATERCFIDLAVRMEAHQLFFHCTNSTGKNPKKSAVEGIGINSVKRRLELLYPGKHNFHVTTSNDVYSVELTLQLNEG